MDQFSRAEKEELLAAAHSTSLRASFDAMRANSARLIRPMTLDEYIEFVTYMNELAGHKPKKFERMAGMHFKL
jgi:hypothetical protein